MPGADAAGGPFGRRQNLGQGPASSRGASAVSCPVVSCSNGKLEDVSSLDAAAAADHSGRSKWRHKQHRRRAAAEAAFLARDAAGGVRAECEADHVVPMDEVARLDHGACREGGGERAGALPHGPLLDEVLPHHCTRGLVLGALGASPRRGVQSGLTDDALLRDRDELSPGAIVGDLAHPGEDFRHAVRQAARLAGGAVEGAVRSLGTLVERTAPLIGDFENSDDAVSGTSWMLADATGAATAPACCPGPHDEAEALRAEIAQLKLDKLREEGERASLMEKLEAARHAIVKTVACLDKIHERLGEASLGPFQGDIIAAGECVTEIDVAMAGLRDHGGAQPAAAAPAARPTALGPSAASAPANAPPRGGDGPFSVDGACWMLGALENMRVQATSEAGGGCLSHVIDNIRRAQHEFVEDIRRRKEEGAAPIHRALGTSGPRLPVVGLGVRASSSSASLDTFDVR